MIIIIKQLSNILLLKFGVIYVAFITKRIKL